MKCAVGKCKQHNSKKTSVSFYSFPKDAAQRKLWVTFCKRVRPVNFDKERICALHFKQEDFERNLKFEMGFSNRRAPKLKPSAVPSIDSSTIESDNETKITDEVEIPINVEIPNEVEIPIKVEIPNEVKIPIKVEMPNEVEIPIKVEMPNEVEFEGKCVEKHTLITTDIKEDGLQLYIKALELKIEALRQENNTLKMSQSQSNITIKKLSIQVQKLSFANVNLEKSLRRMFTEGQIRKLKNNDKRQNFTEADIVQSITLYASSAKTYRLLRKKHFPLPSVRTLQRWSQKLK